MDIFIHLLYFCPPQPRLGAIGCWNAGKVYYCEEPCTGKCGQMVQKFPGILVKLTKRNTLEDNAFFPKTFHLDELFPLNSPWNYRKLIPFKCKRSESSERPPHPPSLSSIAMPLIKKRRILRSCSWVRVSVEVSVRVTVD